MKALKEMGIILALLAFAFTTHAQVEWIGGFPTQETNWDQPANWSTQRVPDQTDEVLIPAAVKGDFFPVIDDRMNAVGYLIVEEGARVVITPHGQLQIDGASEYSFGLYLMGELRNEGFVIIEKTTGPPILGAGGALENRGVVFLKEKARYRLTVIDSPQPVLPQTALAAFPGYTLY